MLLVLEGCNGVGKSHQTAVLSEHFQAPIIRPFRPTPDFHFTGSTQLEQELKELKIPVNTYVDDLYAADLLGKLLRSASVPVVLDRSLPSGLVYGDDWTWENRVRLLSLWQKLLARIAVVKYVWLVCPYSIAAQRLAPRQGFLPTRDLYDRLESRFRDCYVDLKFNKTIIDTGVYSASEVTEQLCRLWTS